jgi:hypothetical protein
MITIPTSLFLIACQPSVLVSCGPGTHQVEDECVPIAATTSTTTETAEPITETSSKTTTSTITHITTGETGETGNDTATPIDDDTVDVYLLAGQSNTSGVGQVWSLPPSLREGQSDVEIFWSGRPDWVPLQPSSEYSSGYATYFGPEVTFGRTLADADTTRDVLIIKHSIGGTDLMYFWNPGGNGRPLGDGWTIFIDTIEQAVTALEAEGKTAVFKGMGWMQGESDATAYDYAVLYEENMNYFIERIRQETSTPDLPFSMGLIDCIDYTTYRQIVREAQLNSAAADPNVMTFETEDLGNYPYDSCHYQGTGMRLLGTRMAQALLGDPFIAFPTPAITMTGSYTYEYSGDFTVGYSFMVNQPILVTDLGRFDMDGDGLTLGADVGIWDHDTQALIASEFVPGYLTGDTSIHGLFRYSATEPFILEPGEYVIGSQSYAAAPYDYVFDAAIEMGSALAFTDGHAGYGSALYFPGGFTTGVSDTNAASWIGPNLLYQPVK